MSICVIFVIAVTIFSVIGTNAESSESSSISGSSNQQCTCPSDKTECSGYDSQLMAEDLVEAVRNFPDLTLPEPPNPWDYDEDEENSGEDDGDLPAGKTVQPGLPNPSPGITDGGSKPKSKRRGSDYKCHGSKCKTCTRELVDRLSHTGWMSDEEKSLMEKRLGISSYGQKQESENCGRMQMHRGINPYEGKSKGPGPGGKGPGAGPPPRQPRGGGPQGGGFPPPFGGPRRRDLSRLGEMNLFRARGASAGNSRSLFGRKSAHNWQSARSGRGQGWLRGGIQGQRNRRKRQTTSVVGQRRTLFCIERGSPVKDGSEWITLCHYCWAWRKLPSDYNPTYINELVCNEEQGDSKCLSKHGTCQQIWRTVDVQKKNGDEWETESIKVGTSCACHVTTDSQAYDLVNGKGFQNG